MASVDASDTVSNSDSETSRNKHGYELQNKTPLQALSHGGVVLGGIPKHVDFRSHCQWQLDHMAAAFRHWHREGYVEGMSGHISVRDPNFPNAFWTNPLGRHFGLLKVGDMILVNLDGSGGGKADRRIIFHNTVRGSVVNEINTGSQIGKIAWSNFW
ncbi:hypothetical protein CFIO01_04187 [Colletotrichum fioriniae PJ7]|uniref:Class II aldolase/adducin N-terminal domain-containing protein n=1 Tax=Colletotrichum fioriniae PJ7 TaxID=1445577 RepID=A0A010RAX2_9PEZI|nr:hypothetical protein CFIO01_04187 [Colletotrichum fioriniae PJ7]